jgi:hypothetical protein
MQAVKQTTAWARANKERAAATQKRSHEKALKRVLKHKEGLGCSICGYNKCGAALDWHHVDPSTKGMKLGIRSYFSKLGEAERNKCILVCANCHREIHFYEKQEAKSNEI